MDTKAVFDAAYTGDAAYDVEHSRARAKQYALIVAEWMKRADIPVTASILEVGCGLGFLGTFPNWRGIEYSAEAVKIAHSIGNTRVEEGDARRLPVRSSSIDFLYSFAALEHVPRVEEAFVEIHRVLRPGGIALLAPAWNCRPWTVRKLELRPYSELSLRDRMTKALIPLRSKTAWRAATSLPARLKREALIARGRDVPLEYKALEPDFSLTQYPHISDCDAFVSMDAHAALAWFRSGKYNSLSHPGFMGRLKARAGPIVVRKLKA
jgi:SAM-dependent methyltransferase